MHTHNLCSCLIGAHPQLPAFPVESFHKLMVGMSDRLAGTVEEDTPPEQYLNRLFAHGLAEQVPNPNNIEEEGTFLILLTQRGIDAFLSVEGFRIDPDEDLLPLFQRKSAWRKTHGGK
jgi:hypothetical protein